MYEVVKVNNGELNNRAHKYFEQGNDFRAEKCFRKLLESSARIEYPHGVLVVSLNFLSCALNNQGKHTEAAEIAQESLDISRLKLSNHPHTLLSMSALATCYTHLRKFNDAYELFDKCIETSKLMNGEDYHTTVHNL